MDGNGNQENEGKRPVVRLGGLLVDDDVPAALSEAGVTLSELGRRLGHGGRRLRRRVPGLVGVLGRPGHVRLPDLARGAVANGLRHDGGEGDARLRDLSGF